MKSQFTESNTNATLLLDYYWYSHLLLYGIVRNAGSTGFLFHSAHMLALSPRRLFVFRLARLVYH